ncbi:disease resistance protein Roq1-like isoform X2 [Euphorbia lathyris]|uniref:disease resistance protein Roq1-like isoform X2 n=1 Tax=Euphorbia lathyris TaxID=212925 RepID=UPI0033132DFC
MSPSSCNSNWTDDVFLSFRGSDVRKGFIGHLYAALCRDGIRTFLDEEKIDYGQRIGPACIKGIQESMIALVILSKDYANSTWCLEELNHILKFKEPDDIWPIYYGVDRSDVGSCSGSYGDALVEHEKVFEEDFIEMCKEDLRKVASLEGPDLQKDLEEHEAKNIDHIVKEISKRLNRTSRCVSIPPVGLNTRANDVISLIGDELEDVRIIGIYGMGGIGKTTLAREVYDKISDNFESKCFLENVSQTSASKGVSNLQRQLLTATLRRKYEKINTVDRGLTLIIERLRRKRILLVLDDVDKTDQISKILGKGDWFFPGSRVIITTRIKDLLQSTESYRQYEVKQLGYGNSLQLLNLHAFDKSCPLGDHMDYAEKFADYSGGNPLALEVLGSSLRGENADAWSSRLEKLKLISNKDIYSKLKLSYDSLDDSEKFIFLDIACFFIGYDKDYVMSILDGCRFFPIDGMNTLMKKCLLKVDSDNKLVMHDLIRDMGREIVRKPHGTVLTDPGRRSRLWHQEDVTDVLTNKMGTKAVEGLILDMPGLKRPWKTKVFKKMKLLRLLQLNHVRLEGSFEYISTKLRWLCWHEFPLGSIPFDLAMDNLVALDLRCSKLKKFSEEVKSLTKLKFLNLSHSHELIETPEFEACRCLEKLVLKDCIKLTRIHNSIGLLSNLVFLNLQECKSLKNLPESSACENLMNLPGSIGDSKALEELNMSGCCKLEELPESVGLLTQLSFLNLQDCKKLKNLPAGIRDLKSLKLNTEGCCSTLADSPESTGVFP